MTRFVSFGTCFLILAACSPAERAGEKASDQRSIRETVTIMTFNVENLFDTTDDAGKDDHTYLPRSVKDDPAHIAKCEAIEVERWRRDCLELDWSEGAVDFKLGQLAKTILQVNEGRGPDIIALQEVENAAIVTRLSNEYLADAGYGDAILIEGQDLRGIDVAFLSRLPLAGDPVLHAFDASAFPDRADDTRGVLQANFELPDGHVLTGFSVHFPAPFHPIEMREVAYDHLNTLRRAVPPGNVVFAAGDFNTPSREMIDTSIMDDRVRPHWIVAHELGCGDCRGTNYWATGDNWSFLDMILFAPAEGAASGWQIQAGSVAIANALPDQMNDDGTVRRFDLEAREGVSDHLPLVVTLESSPGP